MGQTKYLRRFLKIIAILERNESRGWLVTLVQGIDTLYYRSNHSGRQHVGHLGWVYYGEIVAELRSVGVGLKEVHDGYVLHRSDSPFKLRYFQVMKP